MGCFSSKDIQAQENEILHNVINELNYDIKRLQSVTNRIAYDNVMLKEKLYHLEFERKRISI